jgi:hypothetical protein
VFKTGQLPVRYSSTNDSSCPKLAGSAVSWLFFSPQRCREVRPPKVSGSAVSWLLMAFRYLRQLRLPMDAGRAVRRLQPTSRFIRACSQQVNRHAGKKTQLIAG